MPLTSIRAKFASHRELISHLWRFYSVSVINTVFGYGTYAGLVWLGVNLYIAQIAAQIFGMTFNFFMYKTHVFPRSRASIPAYIGTYVLNYFVALVLLAVYDHLTKSAYIAGLLSVLSLSLLNFLMLRLLVFRKAPSD